MWAPTERRLFIEIDPNWWLEVRQSPMSKAQKLTQAELTGDCARYAVRDERRRSIDLV
jgi:hypothetical protein